MGGQRCGWIFDRRGLLKTGLAIPAGVTVLGYLDGVADDARPEQRKAGAIDMPLRQIHLLHYIAERRGQAFDIIEDVIPIRDVRVTLRVPRRVQRVTMVPQERRRSFSREGDRVRLRRSRGQRASDGSRPVLTYARLLHRDQPTAAAPRLESSSAPGAGITVI